MKSNQRTHRRAEAKSQGVNGGNDIVSYFHCASCLAEAHLPRAKRYRQKIEVGTTEYGIQVWGKKHGNMLRLDVPDLPSSMRECDVCREGDNCGGHAK